MKIALPELNKEKIKLLFKKEGLPIYKLAKKIGLSQQSLERMIQDGGKVGPRILSKVAKYFGLNSSDLVIKGQKHPNFYNSFEEKETVYLEKINSFLDLTSNTEYNLSRKFANSRNQLSHKIYNCGFQNEQQLIWVKGFLKAFNETELNLGTSKTRDSDDIEDEYNFLKKQLYVNEPIKRLEDIGIGVYYGHYIYRAMEELYYREPERVNSEEERLVYHYCRPTGKRTEILYFYQKEDFKKLPSTIKIFPEVGYTDEELIAVHKKAMQNVFINIHEHKFFEKVNDYIAFHSSYSWLTVPDGPNQEMVLNDFRDFLHPEYFIHEIENLIWSRNEFKSDKSFDEYTNKIRLRNKTFRDEINNFKFICNDDPNSVPKYDGVVEEEPILSLKTFKKFLDEVEQDKEEGTN